MATLIPELLLVIILIYFGAVWLNGPDRIVASLERLVSYIENKVREDRDLLETLRAEEKEKRRENL